MVLVQVITACTFSKTIAPGLRAGYTFAEPALINHISAVKQGEGPHQPTANPR